MVEKIMKEAVSEDDYHRWDKGLPPGKKAEPKMKEPEPPKIDNLLTLEKFKITDVADISKGRREIKRNKDGIVFIGFDMEISLKDGKSLSGWMPSADFYEFKKKASRDKNLKISLSNVEM